MHGYSGYYGYSVGAWFGDSTTTVGEQMKRALIREGWAFFMALREQITQLMPDNRQIIRPSVPAAVRTWWETTVLPLFGYFSDWTRTSSAANVSAWTTRLAQLRREAAQLGLLVLPSDFFNDVDVALGHAP